jgi:hypothetical protein
MNLPSRLLLSIACVSCETFAGPARSIETRTVSISAPDLTLATLDALRVEPEGAVRQAVRSGKAVELTLDASKRNVVIHAPEACPLALTPAMLNAEPRSVRLVPLITISGPGSDVGFDAPFELSVRTGCAAALRGSIAWSLEGAPLAELSVLEAGYRVAGRTAKMPSRLHGWPPGSIVPVSPAERGSTRLVARWTSPSGAVVVRSVHVSAAPRSRGLPNFGLGERILLAGSGYSVVRRPEGSHADPMPWDRNAHLTSLVPDVAGTWELRLGSRSVTLQAGRFDAVPLDCGRTECHAAETHAAQTSPMTAALARLLDAPEAPTAVACAFGCHTTGEPGTADGGFSHALSDFELDETRLPAWSELPRPLRRLGGVGCLACHGPAQVPEASARWAILRSDVCAYCHDAPPRYQHVSAWRSTRMARADERIETRLSAECARCHTTWGFLDAIAGRDRGLRMPPEGEPPLGISCAACHAVHASNAARPGLLRQVPSDPLYAAMPESALERSSACIACHTPDASSGPSSALLWAGQGAADPVTGAPLLGPAPHAAVPGGCVGCHAPSSAPGTHGRGHSFRPDPRRCSTCHAARPIDRSLFDRARHLLGRNGEPAPLGAPPHARPRAAATVQDRALALARMVLEDRGAAVHNPGYAKLLLDRAASALAHSDPEAQPE